MDVIEMFQVLGIRETGDERAIREAYREKLSVTHPEDDPEGFKRLRSAYEKACAYARAKREEQTDGEAAKERDDTPSGRWLEQAAGIYGNIVTRCDREKWRELFSEDAFLSLEEEENCRLKLLGFLAEHCRLPTDVWKLLDEKLNIVGDSAGLRERFPADFVRYLVNRCERGEDLDFGRFEGDPEAPYDLYLQYYDRCWRAIQEKDLKQAAELIQNAEELSIFHPVMEICKAHLLAAKDRPEEAAAQMRGLFERYPEDSMVAYNTAEILWRCGERAEAAAVYQGILEGNKGHYMANLRLTEWYYGRGEYQKAKECADKVLAFGGDDRFMELLAQVNREIEKELEEHYRREHDAPSGLELCWCYLQDGRIHRGIRLAEALSGSVPLDRETEYQGLLAKLYIEGVEFEQSAECARKWEEALSLRLKEPQPLEERERDLDRLRQSHIIRMQCFRAIGDQRSDPPEARRESYEKAIREGEAALNGSAQDVGICLGMAQIYLEMEEYERALQITGRLVEEYQAYAAYATEQEIYRRQWNAAGVVRSGQNCLRHFPDYARAYEHIAKVYLDLGRREELAELLAEAEKHRVKSVILDAYRFQMTQKPPETEVLYGRLREFRRTYFARAEEGDKSAYEEGLPILTEYLYWYPGTYMLVERALFHRIARHYDEAKEDLEKALQENPCQPYALNGLSFVYKYQGDYERALFYLKRALRCGDEGPNTVIYADLSNLYSLLGDDTRALSCYEQYAASSGRLSDYHAERLALCLARAGRKQDAVQTIEDAFRDRPLERFDRLVDLHQITGDREAAAGLLREWKKQLAGGGRSPAGDREPYYIRMAWQSALFGDGRRAVRCYDRILARSRNRNSAPKPQPGTLGDAVFLCILTGRQKRGRKLGGLLRERLGEAAVTRLENKSALYQMFLAEYYFAPEEELERLLEQEQGTETCRSCQYGVCRELEAVRIVFLLRQGNRREALRRVEENLERQPLDEYGRAIRNLCRQDKAAGKSGFLSAFREFVDAVRKDTK